MTRKIKWLFYILIIASILYSAFWFKISYDIAQSVNSKYSGGVHRLSVFHSIQFKDVSPAGFPFSFGVEIHDLTENTSKGFITHTAPLYVGYNILTQKLTVKYSGDSLIEIKSGDKKQHLKSHGNFEYSAILSLNLFDLLSSTKIKDLQEEIATNIKSVEIHLHDASLVDTDNDIKIVERENMDFSLVVTHHKKYKSFKEFMTEIPRDYSLALKIHNVSSPNQNITLPQSIVFFNYFPLNVNYTLSADIHTDATEFKIGDVLQGFSIKNYKSTIINDFQESRTNLNFESKALPEQIGFSLDSNSEFKIKPGYSKELDDAVKKLSSILPNASSRNLQSTLRQVDLSALSMDTGKDPLIMSVKAKASLLNKNDNQPSGINFNIPLFSVKFRDTSFDVKNHTEVKFDESNSWESEGVLSVQEYQILTKFLIDSYFAIYHLPENTDFNRDFYLSTFTDVITKTANSISNNNKSIVIEYKLMQDIKNARLGKFSWSETTLLYYSTLLKHIGFIYKNPEEAIEKFKSLVPSYVTEDSDSMSKIISQSKEQV